jgi:hypothetical protein
MVDGREMLYADAISVPPLWLTCTASRVRWQQFFLCPVQGIARRAVITRLTRDDHTLLFRRHPISVWQR